MMRTAERILNQVAARMFRMGAPSRRVPHRVFQDLGARVRAALDEAEVCLHPEVISRPNVLEVFFDLDTWGRLVAPREADVHRALEAEVEAHRARAGYGPSETIALRLFVADPEQIRVPANRPEVVARRVADPLSIDGAWRSALRHTTVVGSVVRRKGTTAPRGPDTHVDRAPRPHGTPLAILRYSEGGAEREAKLAGAGVFGRGAGCEVQLDPHATGATSAVSRRALSFAPHPVTGVLEVENLGKVALAVSGASASRVAPGERVSVAKRAVLTWPEEEGFTLEVEAPSRGEVVLTGGTFEQRVVLRAPRTRVAADAAAFGAVDVVFHVDFVDGTRFLVLNNEGSVPIRLGALEGKQLQWPIDAPREIEAGPLRVTIRLEDAP